ncbi:dipeptidyl aminopeptidase [Bradyrhizobium brasilense]|uniref:alpha/beta hydrolase family protein n=1 Tax=Bradyrhizobium brasilense TaxID=1419277 RepID=UPI000975DCC7|nr:alpha/beta hydrolase [Bradyrhizobium brasilense]OMI05838.1 dipeptidyl aminopeptidase [Bradyrhizobium brasilense]
MKFLFRNESFSFETLRTAGFATYGGADLGEVLATARLIPNGNEEAWLKSWTATADRVANIAETSLSQGHRVSAREAFLRASNYYRTAEFFRRHDPANDREVTRLSNRSCETFVAAAKLLGSPFEVVTIPYENTTLPGYLFLVDDSGAPRPTVIYNNGFDSTQEESYVAIGAAALRRGYNVLTFDGPGQGAAIRRQKLVFRHDWEAVIKPVIDYANTRSEIDAGRLALFGYSLGAYLVARAAAFDRRAAAIILDDGIFDFHAALEKKLPGFLLKWIYNGDDRKAIPLMKLKMAIDSSSRWGLSNGTWTFGSRSIAEFVRQTRQYTLKGIVDSITTPALVLDAENDQFLKGQPEKLHAALKSNSRLVTLTDAEGAGEHCHMGAMSRLHQVIFDWLDDTLAAR